MSELFLTLLLTTQGGQQFLEDNLYLSCVSGAYIGAKKQVDPKDYNTIMSYCTKEAKETVKFLSK